jgi:hypothetical protein
VLIRFQPERSPEGSETEFLNCNSTDFSESKEAAQFRDSEKAQKREKSFSFVKACHLITEEGKQEEPISEPSKGSLKH